jgi:hypothetical protein
VLCFLGEASLRGRWCHLSNKVDAEDLVFIKDCRALVWGMVFIIMLLARFVLVFRWCSSRYWKISILVDSLWKIETKLIGSPAWSLSCGIRLLGLSLRVFLVDWSANCSIVFRSDWFWRVNDRSLLLVFDRGMFGLWLFHQVLHRLGRSWSGSPYDLLSSRAIDLHVCSNLPDPAIAARILSLHDTVQVKRSKQIKER